MATWRLRVSTRFRASVREVWDHKTDIRALAAEFGPVLTLAVDDPEGLQGALRGAGERTFRGRVCGPLGLIGLPWPFEIREVHAPRFYRDTSRNALYRAWEHRHLVEPEADGIVRYTDEVTFRPWARPSRLAAELTAATFRHRHQRAARALDAVEVGAVALERLRERPR